MTRMLLEVVCPATGKHYDFWISKKLRVGDIIEKLITEISGYENNRNLFDDASSMVLMSTKFGVLNIRFTLAATGLCSGDTVVLI